MWIAESEHDPLRPGSQTVSLRLVCREPISPYVTRPRERDRARTPHEVRGSTPLPRHYGAVPPSQGRETDASSSVAETSHTPSL